MRMPREIDAVDLLYAAHALCAGEPLSKQGLNRNGLRRAKKALEWFIGGIHESIKARTKRVKRVKKRS